MKKIILFSSVFALSLTLAAQNCIQTLPSTVIPKKTNGSQLQAGDAIWICENITFDVTIGPNVVYVEKGGNITISGNDVTVYMKSPGTLTITGDDGFYTVDSSVTVIDNGSNSTVDLCLSADPITFDYSLITGVTDCIDTGTVGITRPKVVHEIQLFPNPVKNVLNVNIPGKVGPSVFRVYSISGNVVLEGVIASSFQQIDMTGLDRGLYFIEIQNESGKISKRLSLE